MQIYIAGVWVGYLTLTNQDIEGDIIVDSISSLTINLVFLKY